MAIEQEERQESPQNVSENDDLSSAGARAGLGRDEPVLASEPPDEPDDQEEPETPEAAETLSAEDIEALKEKAASFDWLTKQQDLMDVMSNYLREKNSPKPAPRSGRGDDSEIGQLRQTVSQLVNELELTQFVALNPTLSGSAEARAYWGELVRDGLSKEKAFDLTKREFELRQARQPKAPKLQGSERGHVGGGERSQISQRFERAIKSARDGADAVDAAWRAELEARGIAQ